MCIFQHVERKNVLKFQSIRRLVSTTVRSAKPFNDQKPTIVSFGGDVTHCFVKKTSRDYRKEKSSTRLKKILRQSQSPTPEQERKKAKIVPFMT